VFRYTSGSAYTQRDSLIHGCFGLHFWTSLVWRFVWIEFLEAACLRYSSSSRLRGGLTRCSSFIAYLRHACIITCHYRIAAHCSAERSVCRFGFPFSLFLPSNLSVPFGTAGNPSHQKIEVSGVGVYNNALTNLDMSSSRADETEHDRPRRRLLLRQ
jgi:hypothetical protein